MLLLLSSCLFAVYSEILNGEILNGNGESQRETSAQRLLAHVAGKQPGQISALPSQARKLRAASPWFTRDVSSPYLIRTVNDFSTKQVICSVFRQRLTCLSFFEFYTMTNISLIIITIPIFQSINLIISYLSIRLTTYSFPMIIII